MRRKHPISESEIAERLAELEQRSAKHEAAIKFMKTLLDHLKESGVSLDLTEEQRDELSRWMNEFEKDIDARASWRQMWERIRKK